MEPPYVFLGGLCTVLYFFLLLLLVGAAIASS
jgi:hypothetical protein